MYFSFIQNLVYMYNRAMLVGLGGCPMFYEAITFAFNPRGLHHGGKNTYKKISDTIRCAIYHQTPNIYEQHFFLTPQRSTVIQVIFFLLIFFFYWKSNLFHQKIHQKLTSTSESLFEVVNIIRFWLCLDCAQRCGAAAKEQTSNQRSHFLIGTLR